MTPCKKYLNLVEYGKRVDLHQTILDSECSRPRTLQAVAVCSAIDTHWSFPHEPTPYAYPATRYHSIIRGRTYTYTLSPAQDHRHILLAPTQTLSNAQDLLQGMVAMSACAFASRASSAAPPGPMQFGARQVATQAQA